jgi:hypothetical protein
MSVFQVKLVQGIGRTAQGFLDPSVVNGASIQRTMYAPGPNKVNRVLFDGQTFTDVNYWKRFAYPALPFDQAFIQVVYDDGSVWNDFGNENGAAASYSTIILHGTTYGSHLSGINRTSFTVLTDFGSPAVFTQITNSNTANPNQFITVRVNGTATFPLYGGQTQTFDKGDLPISLLEFDNSTSGNVDTPVNIFMSIQQIAQS